MNLLDVAGGSWCGGNVERNKSSSTRPANTSRSEKEEKNSKLFGRRSSFSRVYIMYKPVCWREKHSRTATIIIILIIIYRPDALCNDIILYMLCQTAYIDKLCIGMRVIYIYIEVCGQEAIPSHTECTGINKGKRL